MNLTNENVSNQGQETSRNGNFEIIDNGKSEDNSREIILGKCRVKVSSDGVYESLPVEKKSIDAKSSEKANDKIQGDTVFEVLPR